MHESIEVQRRLERVFGDAFRVADIAESLVSFDAELPAAAALRRLERRRFTIAGVREGGLIEGYARTADLRGARGAIGEHAREFEDADVVAGEARLADALGRLRGREWLAVTAFGRVAGIVTWSDVQKPPVRMWLFGLVTVLESSFTSLVELWYPDESWRARLSAGRLAKAEALLRERRRLEAGEPSLLDCLQLSDKGQLLLRDAETRSLLGFASKEAGERAIRRLGRLRDSLAHAQDIVSDDWELILAAAERMPAILQFASVFPVRRRSKPGGRRS